MKRATLFILGVLLMVSVVAGGGVLLSKTDTVSAFDTYKAGRDADIKTIEPVITTKPKECSLYPSGAEICTVCYSYTLNGFNSSEKCGMVPPGTADETALIAQYVDERILSEYDFKVSTYVEGK